MSRERTGKINVNKLDADIRASRFNRSGLSRELHLSESYVSKCISTGLMSRSAEAFTCNLLGRPAGYYFEKEEEQKTDSAEVETLMKDMLSIGADVDIIKNRIESLKLQQEEIAEYLRGLCTDIIDIADMLKVLKTIAGDLHWLVAQEQQKPWTKQVTR